MPIQGSDGTPSSFVPDPTRPFGVWGDSGSPGPFGAGGNGVLASSQIGSAVAGFSLNTQLPSNAAGVFGRGVVGVSGTVTGANTLPSVKVGVYGSGSNGSSLGAVGVQGESDTSIGVHGTSISGVGVFGKSSTNGNNFGVVGTAPNAGVAAFNPNNTHAAYLASDCCAAWFTGDVVVAGTLIKSGGGFQIDHPLDPAGKYLSHSFVESSDMKNFYDGIVTADSRGESLVELPVWFEALNTDFRYQLTSVGASAPNLHVAEEISNHHFKIVGAVPGTKVSWLVTGVRRDAWANAHRVRVEKVKPATEHGCYLHPELHGASEEQSIARVRHPHQTMR